MRFSELFKNMIWILLLPVLMLTGCKKLSERQLYKVSEVIRGDLVRIGKGGHYFKLVGVEDSEDAHSILKKNLIGSKVRIKLDTKYPKLKYLDKTQYSGYIILESGLCLNSMLISKKHSLVEEDEFFDSLEVYRQYSNRSSLEAGLGYSFKSPAERGLAKPLSTIVAESEKSIFLIKVYNRKNVLIRTGTGFFIAEDNIAISNYHIFEVGSNIEVETYDGESNQVTKILKTEKNLDYIIFKVQSRKKYSSLAFTERESLKGEDVIVIGNPRGLSNTISRGVVSAFRSYRGWDQGLIQIDAAISPGSSGSPVLNVFGEVIGIATLKMEDCENCNFCISSMLIKK